MKTVEIDQTLNRLKIKFDGPDFRQSLEQVKRLQGRVFDGPTKSWLAPTFDMNIKILQACNFTFLSKVNGVEVMRGEIETPKKGINRQLLHPDLFNYQIEGIEFLEGVSGNGMILDEPGVGKTAQAVSYLKLHPELRPCLIISPAHLKINWQRELEKWGNLKSEIIHPKSRININSGIYIINYNILDRFVEDLMDAQFKIVIADETQYVANARGYKPKTKEELEIERKANNGMEPEKKGKVVPVKRTKAFIDIVRKTPHKIFLSGTPIRNRPREFYTTLNLIAPCIFNNNWLYLQTYCFPKEAPILMGDLTEKPINEIKIGDWVVGWQKGIKKGSQRRLCEAQVTNILKRKSKLQKIYLENKSILICTPDHKWLHWLSKRRCDKNKEYQIAHSGRLGCTGRGLASKLVKIIKPPKKYIFSNSYKLGYIAGAFHGDGWCSKTHKTRESPLRGKNVSLYPKYTIGIAVKDKEIINRVYEFLNLFKIKSSLGVRKDGLFSLSCCNENAFKFISQLKPNKTLDWFRGFLGGIYDTEGHGSIISQYKKINLITYRLIEITLSKLGFDYYHLKGGKGIGILNGRKGVLKLWSLGRPVVLRKLKFALYNTGGRFMTETLFITKIKPMKGIHDVYTLTTSTGNYVAYGMGSKNCNAKRTHWGWSFDGATNMDKLHNLIQSFTIRRKKEDVLKELPAKQKFIIPLDLDDIHGEDYRNEDMKFVQWLTETKHNNIEKKNKTESLKELAYLAKRESLMAWIKEFLNSGKKLVVYAYHLKVLDDIEEKFKDICVRIDGSVPSTKRQELVDKFQNDENTKLFIGQILTGTGITLTAASALAFAEFWWVPADMEQNEDRIHRIGTKENVQIYYLTAADTIEDDIAYTLTEKFKVISSLLDGKANDEFLGQDFLDLILKRVVEKNRKRTKEELNQKEGN